MKRIPINRLAPLRAQRPDNVRHFVSMMREGKRAPAIWVIKQRRGNRYPYRIFDGAHRVAAARRIGQKTIETHVLTEE
jgi:uncharacterized ParB-like nuclease family protein